jgi:anaerobic ribonucleoside-triphosphate reductase
VHVFATPVGLPVASSVDMPRGANPKREREYEELVDRFEQEGRYKGRQKEVAARIVNRQRAEYGETKGAMRQEREGRAPDKDLPIDNYRHLTIPQIAKRLDDLSGRELRQIESYEKDHKKRKGVLERIARARA